MSKAMTLKIGDKIAIYSGYGRMIGTVLTVPSSDGIFYARVGLDDYTLHVKQVRKIRKRIPKRNI